MTSVLDANDLFRDALMGRPFTQIVVPQTLNTHTPLVWIVGDWDAHFPAVQPRPAPDIREMVSKLRGWTGWSTRQLGNVVDTTHTTIIGIEKGRPLIHGHSGELRRRISDTYNVVERIFLMAGRNQAVTVHLLETAPAGRTSAAEALRLGATGDAYLAALDVLRPREQGLLVADHPRQGGATAALHE